jgi:acetyl esterase/lipase
MKKLFYIILLLFISTFISNAQENTSFSQEEVIYARKHGMALTMVVLKPEKTNGKAIVSVMSGAWYSRYSFIEKGIDKSAPFLKNGYTVFLTLHRSNPKFDILDGVTDIQNAVQYIRFNAEKLKIDPNNIGITGRSSGGHLSLVVSTADDLKDSKSKKPIKRVSSKVQAVAVFSPPTDFLNWGRPNGYMNHIQHANILAKSGILGALKFKIYDSEINAYRPIMDSIKLRIIAKSVSPAQLVTKDDAPTYIIHGDSDPKVPLQQSQHIKKEFDRIGIPSILKIKAGVGHSWDDMNIDRLEFVKWFDKYLKVAR